MERRADYQRLLAIHGILGSMSRRGNCWDSAVAESFFATLKVELAHGARWPTRGVAQGEVFEYLEHFYNGQRRHSTLGYVSSAAFERQWVAAREPGAVVAPQPLATSGPEEASSVEAPGSAIARGAAIPVLPKTVAVGRLDDASDILDAASVTGVGTEVPCLITP